MTSERLSSLDIVRNVNGIRRPSNRIPIPTDWTAGITVKRYANDKRKSNPRSIHSHRVLAVSVKSPPADSVANGELPVEDDSGIIRAISAEESRQLSSSSVGKSGTRLKVSRITPVGGSPNRRYQQSSSTNDMLQSNHDIGQLSLTIKPVSALSANDSALAGLQLNCGRNYLPNAKTVFSSEPCHRMRPSGSCSTHIDDVAKHGMLVTSSNGTPSMTARTLDVFLPPINPPTNDD